VNDDLGALVDDRTIRFERRLPAPVERVWRAVTDPEEMRAWFPSAVVGERAVGARLEFRFDVHVPEGWDGEVTEWDPMRVFAFTWNGDQLRIELRPDGDATALVFTHVVYDRSAAARTGAGWHACLADLVAHAGGVPADPDAWSAVYDAYVDRMGPPAGERDGSTMTWRRMTHVDAAGVQAATMEPGPWGAGDRASEPIEWLITAAPGLTEYRLVHATAGEDADTAAAWHALLLQLDMWLAARQLVPADPARFLPLYR
jgi:uncharacterized protein YndB with AHSA1/START domain